MSIPPYILTSEKQFNQFLKHNNNNLHSILFPQKEFFIESSYKAFNILCVANFTHFFFTYLVFNTSYTNQIISSLYFKKSIISKSIEKQMIQSKKKHVLKTIVQIFSIHLTSRFSGVKSYFHTMF